MVYFKHNSIHFERSVVPIDQQFFVHVKLFKEYENLSVEKKTLSTALGFEPMSFDYRSTALTTELHRSSTSASPQENLGSYSRKAEPLGDIGRSSCGEGEVERLCSSTVRAVDWQLEDLGSNPNAVESVFFSTERFSNSLNI